MEEMLKKIENIINNYNFDEKIEIVEYICKNFYLTQSEIREIFQILDDMSSVNKENLYKIINGFEIDINLNLKKRGEGFLEYIRRARHPVIYEAKRKADERAVKIKGKNIKISYPENFEGSGIKIELTFDRVKDVKQILEKLNGSKQEIEELVEIVKNGG